MVVATPSESLFELIVGDFWPGVKANTKAYCWSYLVVRKYDFSFSSSFSINLNRFPLKRSYK